MAILNLTQHNATVDQVEAGVTEPNLADKVEIQKLLTFDELPTKALIHERAHKLAAIANRYDLEDIMIGGAPFLMGPLATALFREGLEPVFAFSTRVVEEQVQPDGSVKKASVFKHQGFVGV